MCVLTQLITLALGKMHLLLCEKNRLLVLHYKTLGTIDITQHTKEQQRQMRERNLAIRLNVALEVKVSSLYLSYQMMSKRRKEKKQLTVYDR